MDPKRTTTRHVIIKMPKVEDKERILKAAREKQLVTYKEAFIRLSTDFSSEIFQSRRDWHKYSNKKQGCTIKTTYPRKAVI